MTSLNIAPLEVVELDACKCIKGNINLISQGCRRYWFSISADTDISAKNWPIYRPIYRPDTDISADKSGRYRYLYIKFTFAKHPFTHPNIHSFIHSSLIHQSCHPKLINLINIIGVERYTIFLTIRYDTILQYKPTIRYDMFFYDTIRYDTIFSYDTIRHKYFTIFFLRQVMIQILFPTIGYDTIRCFLTILTILMIFERELKSQLQTEIENFEFKDF